MRHVLVFMICVIANNSKGKFFGTVFYWKFTAKFYHLSSKNFEEENNNWWTAKCIASIFVPRFSQKRWTLKLISLFVPLSVCPSVCHKALTWLISNNRALIFGMYDTCDKSFLSLPCGAWLWPWPSSRLFSNFGNWTSVPSLYSWNIGECDVKPKSTTSTM